MDRILATLMFFTRLPFWRIKQVDAEHFKHVVPLWPLAGWLTGGIMVGVLWLAAQVFPLSVAWIIAIIARLLITGCLHEDGLADFCDGMGGGVTRERILLIMKDSHIGTYGVIGLIIYFLLLTQMSALPLSLLCTIVFTGDVWCKFVSSHIINILPYARKEEEAKNKTVYQRMTALEAFVGAIIGCLPFVLFLPKHYWPALLAPVVVFILLVWLMKRRIQGYTGDCCGALFLISELSFLLVCLAKYFFTIYD
ncbi:MAG: adenosylcobinamide-GDP ribazoletransferase [Bacteroidaceae bacterium]|nr:adenosylcobinamide-GDP ribazoletransferase [Bacteroidaceae bacterium]MBP3833734.1 adenosylcobinamide-GDP ribazoletransferase [Bacteroidaceae bacterium]